MAAERVEGFGELMAERLHQELQEWKSVIKEQDIRLQSLLNTAFQLANYYFVFQGVILAAISNAKPLTCKDRWFLFTLSFLAIILNLCALLVIGTKYVNGLRERHESWTSYNRVGEQQQRLNLQQARRPPQGIYVNNMSVRDKCAESKQRVLFALCVVMFLVFAGVTLAGCLGINCHHHGDEYANQCQQIDVDTGCIKFCDGLKCIKFCHN